MLLGDVKLSAAKKIKILLAEREITMTDLAKKLNTGLSNITGKMKRNNFSEKELREIFAQRR
jgi:IS30 family transposase